jgi:leader peptidase (prepilin peptidase) / N-methyltransferase
MSFFVFVVGLCFGSFVNMLVWRTSIGKTKSKFSICDFCGKKLNWWNNIPVFSWIMQKGKSQCCAKKLDWSYPLVELLMGILFLINYLIFNNIIFYLILVLVVYSAVYDAKTMYLPDWSTWSLIFLSLFFVNSIGNIYSAIGASGFLLLLYLITKGKGMGLGDVYLAVFMGLLLGWPKIMVAFYIAFIVGALYGIIIMIGRKKKFKSEIPFGPFLLLGTIVSWYFGNFVVNLVYRWF